MDKNLGISWLFIKKLGFKEEWDGMMEDFGWMDE